PAQGCPSPGRNATFALLSLGCAQTGRKAGADAEGCDRHGEHPRSRAAPPADAAKAALGADGGGALGATGEDDARRAEAALEARFAAPGAAKADARAQGRPRRRDRRRRPTGCRRLPSLVRPRQPRCASYCLAPARRWKVGAACTPSLVASIVM